MIVATFDARLGDADDGYDRITPASLSENERRVERQAVAGMLWSRPYDYFRASTLMNGWTSIVRTRYWGPGALRSRNAEWFHMLNSDIIFMPNQWEYPSYAAWDLMFHTIAPSLVDCEFAEEQLPLMLKTMCACTNERIPASSGTSAA